MARPKAKGMEYFPHDTNALNDEKVEYLTANFKELGYAFYFIMLERIYRTENYELDLSNEATVRVLEQKTFSDAETFQKLIRISVEIGLFDKELWDEKKVLTSNGIKERAKIVEDKRLNSRFSYQKRVSAAETTPETPQSKVKESKVKESKVLLDRFPFETFWELYDKKVGKPKAMKLWSKLTPEEKEKAFEHIPKYIESQPDKKYRKNPETYLNQKAFNDEVINGHPNNIRQSEQLKRATFRHGKAELENLKNLEATLTERYK